MKLGKRLRPLMVVILATSMLMVTMSRVGAQGGIPDGVFVRESNGTVWLVLGGQRISVPIWQASDADIAALPDSGQWAVMNDGGAITSGDRPAWFPSQAASSTPILQSPLATPTTSTRAVATSTPTTVATSSDSFADREDVAGVSGQNATATFGSTPMKATVREMFTVSRIAAVKRGYSTYEAAEPQGKFVIVVVDLENVGQRAECCVPGYHLQDAKKRSFSGKTQRADSIVQQVAALLDIKSYSGDLQPNLPVRHVMVFDVPSDATSLRLTS